MCIAWRSVRLASSTPPPWAGVSRRERRSGRSAASCTISRRSRRSSDGVIWAKSRRRSSSSGDAIAAACSGSSASSSGASSSMWVGTIGGGAAGVSMPTSGGRPPSCGTGTRSQNAVNATSNGSRSSCRETSVQRSAW